MFPRSSKIAIRVILAFLALVIFQGGVSIAGVAFLISRANQESLQGQMRGTVEAVAAYIDDAIRDLKVKASLLAGQRKVIDYTEYGLANLLQQEFGVYRLPMKIDALCVLRADSSVIAATGEPWVVGLAVENRLVGNYLNGSPVFILNHENKMYLWLLSPVLHDRAVIGYLAMAVQLDRAFLRPLESATGARVMLSLRNQAFVSTGLPDSVTIHILEAYYRRSFNSRSMISGRVGTLVYRAAVIPSLPELYTYCFLDTVELQNLLRQYSLFSIVFLFLVLLIGFALALLIYRLTFLRPLTLFMEGVKRVAEGDLAYTMTTSTEDEFGDLARAFTHMTRSLRAREHEIAELGRYNALILSNVPSGILTLDLEGKVSGFNPRLPVLLQLAEGELRTGRPIEELLPDAAVLATIRAALEREEYVSLRDAQMPAADGGPRILSVSTSPFISSDNARIGVLVVVLDVTKERNLEEKLAVSSRMAAMGEMVAGVAHQIRNPLAIMKVSAQLLRDARPGSGEPAKLSGVIVEEVDSLDTVVGRLLDFVRPLSVHRAPCDVPDLVRRTVSFLPLERFREVRLECRHDDAPASWPLDGALVQQALANVITNALEASRPGGVVRVSAGRDAGRLVLEVRDQGRGMSAATRRNAFNPFFTTKDRGTGLGLSIAHKIVEGHGGAIELSSAPEEGTTFRIIL